MPTATLVDSTLRWMKLDETVRGMRAMRAFCQIAGPRINARARAERLRGRTLFVRVASAAWSQELHALRAPILERLRTTPGGEDIDDLRFQVGDVNGLPDWSALEASAAEPPPRARAKTPTIAPAIYEALAQIPDEELRDRFTALLGRASRRRPSPE